MSNLKVQIKEEIRDLAINSKKKYEDISSYIFDNPELAFEEFKAQKVLSDCLEESGFEVKRGIANLETSFEAIYSKVEGGPTIAFLAEYDALPEIGHACGHNIIGTSSVGAGIVLKNMMDKYNIPGTIKVIGTPAEERVGSKISMIREGVFKDLDAAFILHPADASMPDDISFACINLEICFEGKASHAAAFPWGGSSALNGVIVLFNNVNSMRLHLKDYTRVHGIITEGGTMHNIIPAKATAVFNIRSLSIDYLNEVVEMLKNCANGAAIATGTTVKVTQLDEIYKEVRNDKKLVKLIRDNFDFIKEDYIERDLTQGIGSTDIGNVTHEIPAIQAYIKLDENAATHTIEFAKAAGGQEGKDALLKGIQVLAMSGLDLFYEGGINYVIKTSYGSL